MRYGSNKPSKSVEEACSVHAVRNDIPQEAHPWHAHGPSRESFPRIDKAGDLHVRKRHAPLGICIYTSLGKPLIIN